MVNLKSNFLRSLSLLVLLLSGFGAARAETVVFSAISDALPNRCYDPATTLPDATNPNRLNIGMHSGIVGGTFGTSAACFASDDGPGVTNDTISFIATAPEGYYVSKVTFTQNGTTSGSRGGRGFRSAMWVVGTDAATVTTTTTGWAAVADLTGQNRTSVQVSINTFLAGAGGTVRSGSATASNASALVEVLPLVGDPAPPPPPPLPNPVPQTSSVSPATLTAGGPSFTLTVQGENFVTGSVVRWNGVNRPTTAITSKLLQANIAASDIASQGSAVRTATITVVSPSSPTYGTDGGESNAQFITINPAPPPNPVPITTSIEPAEVVSGSGAFTLTVHGSGFFSGSVIRYETLNLATTFVSPTKLTAPVSALFASGLGAVSIRVVNPATGFNPAPDGGTSNAQTLTLVAPPPPPGPVPGPTPVTAHGNVDDQRGKEWRQLTQTVGLSRAQVAAICPADGATPYLCNGKIGTVDLTGWVWAQSNEVIELFRFFTAAVSATTPSVSGTQYAPFASSFQSLFGLTQRVSGCPTYQGCFDFSFVGGISASTDTNGATIAGGVSLSQENVGPVGALSVTNASAFGGVTFGVFLWRPTGLVGGTVHALNDSGQTTSPLGGTVLNAMSNDWVAGVQASSINAATTLAGPISASTSGITLASNGNVQAQAGTLAGSYTLPYQICALSNSANCSSALATIVIRSFPLLAANDQAFASFGSGGVAVNVLNNDTLNGVVVNTTAVSLRQVSTTHAGIALNLTNGAVNVQANTPSATHTLVYEVCELASPTNCRQATVTLMARSIDAVNDVFAKISKDGGITPSVLTNDRLNGAPVSAATVQLSLLTALPAGVTFNLTSGQFAANDAESGDYPMTYRICEIASPSNCDSASLTLEISGSDD